MSSLLQDSEKCVRSGPFLEEAPNLMKEVEKLRVDVAC